MLAYTYFCLNSQLAAICRKKTLGDLAFCHLSSIFCAVLCWHGVRCVCLSLTSQYSNSAKMAKLLMQGLTQFSHPQRRWGRLELAIFDQYLAISEKLCKRGSCLLWKANRNSHQMMQFPVTLCNPNHPKPSHFPHFVSPFMS